MSESKGCPLHSSARWKDSVCPVLRPLDSEPTTTISQTRLGSFLRHEVGVSGILLLCFRWHLYVIGGNGGLAPTDLRKSFVLDSVFSGVTRCGTSAVTFTTIYELLDPGGTAGNRRITKQQLPRFAALLRIAFPRTGLMAVRREISITMTTIEWSMLIRAFGDRVEGQLALQENVHREIIEGRVLQPGKKRNLALIHLIPGVWSAFLSHFVRVDSRGRDAAAAAIGANAPVQPEQ